MNSLEDDSEAAQRGLDTFEDVVRDFLLGERRLLEKELEGEPTTGERQPTKQRFDLVDTLLERYGSASVRPEDFETALVGLAGSRSPLASDSAGTAEQADQAAQMLSRWKSYRLIDQPTAQRTPYEPSE
jgi:hypothetical protein